MFFEFQVVLLNVDTFSSCLCGDAEELVSEALGIFECCGTVGGCLDNLWGCGIEVVGLDSATSSTCLGERCKPFGNLRSNRLPGLLEVSHGFEGRCAHMVQPRLREITKGFYGMSFEVAQID